MILESVTGVVEGDLGSRKVSVRRSFRRDRRKEEWGLGVKKTPLPSHPSLYDFGGSEG